MPANPLSSIKTVVDLVGTVTNVTRSGAEELFALATANRSVLEDMVRREIETQLARLGLASRAELNSAQAEVMRLRAQLEELKEAIGRARSEVPEPDPYVMHGFESAAEAPAADVESPSATITPATAPTARPARSEKTATPASRRPKRAALRRAAQESALEKAQSKPSSTDDGADIGTTTPPAPAPGLEADSGWMAATDIAITTPTPETALDVATPELGATGPTTPARKPKKKPAKRPTGHKAPARSRPRGGRAAGDSDAADQLATPPVDLTPDDEAATTIVERADSDE